MSEVDRSQTRLVALTRDVEGGIFVSSEYLKGVRVLKGGLELPLEPNFIENAPGGIEIDTPAFDFYAPPLITRHPSTDAELLSGQRGTVDLRYKLYASNMHGARLYEIRDYSDASVDLSNYRDHTWELSLSMWFSADSVRESLQSSPFEVGWIKAEAELYDGSRLAQTFALGLYRIAEAEDSSTREITAYSVIARSAEDTLLDDNAHLGHSVLPGRGVLAEVRDILLWRGFSPERVQLPPLGRDRALATGMYFDPIADHAGTYWLRICNALLNAGGFYALYTDSEGRFTTQKIRERADREPDVFYCSDADSQLGYEYGLSPDLLVHGELSGKYETEGFENRVVVMSTDVNTVPPIYVVVENRDPNSVNSIQNRGVKSGEPIALANIATREDAEAIGQAEIAKRSGIDRKVTLRTMPDPRRTARETYLLGVWLEDKRVVAQGVYFVSGYRLPLTTEAEAVMEHELSTVAEEGEVSV